MHKWASAIDGDEDGIIEEWARGLAGLSGEQIKKGLNEWDNEWPPSMNEFKKCCLGAKTNEYGLNFIPHYYSSGQRITNKHQILSSNDRESIRTNNLAALREARNKLKV